MLHDLRSTREILGKLNHILSKPQKRYAVLVFAMTIVGGIFETLGVSIVLPLVQVMIQPEQLLRNQYVALAAETLSLDTMSKFVTTICIATILIYVVKNLYMCLLTYVKTTYSNKIGRELATQILKAYTQREYVFFLGYSSSECLRDIGTDVGGVINVLTNGFSLLTDCITVFLIVIFILCVNYKFALVVLAIAALCLLLVLKIFKNLCREWGQQQRTNGEQVYKYSLELFQGIKEIKILGRRRFFVRKYEEANERQSRLNGKYAIALASPAYMIEALFVSGFLITLCLGNVFSADLQSMVPQLAAFAIAAFRVLPSLGKISSSINNVIYSVPMVNATYEHMKDVREKGMRQEEEDDNVVKAKFENEISINHISWQYPKAENKVIDGLSMKIRKGMSVAFIGASGAGKTTLADIILGLLQPQEGNVTLDGKDIRELGRGWSNLLGYVPQASYLINDTIRNNVAFGIEAKYIDDEKVWDSLEQAQLKEFVESLPYGLETKIGEAGTRVSGGQKQRLAIARALYYNPEILVLDEATSALDNETERAFIEAIERLQGHKTMIIVAHRLTTVRNCDIIYEIADGIAVERDKRELFEAIADEGKP